MISTMPPNKSGLTAAMRFFRHWWDGQDADYQAVDERGPFYSSQFDLGADNGRCVAKTLMDLMVDGEWHLIEEDGEYEPLGIQAVLDKMAHTQFLFNDGSAIELDKWDKWWRVSGEIKMMESHEYAYNADTGKIESRDRVRADQQWPPPNGDMDEHEAQAEGG
jgi:hypothetical protein